MGKDEEAYERLNKKCCKGSGSGLETITPKGFDGFYHELETFVSKHLEG